MHIKHALVGLVAATLTMADANAIQARASVSSAQLPTSLQQPSPTPSQSANTTAGCKCDSGWPQGQYCGWCGPVQNGVSGDVYECGPNGECHHYGHRDSCSGGKFCPCGPYIPC